MSGGGSSVPENTTQTTTKEIPAWAQPAAQSLLQRGTDLSYQPFIPYQNQRIANATGEQVAGLDAIANRAINGSPEELSARQNYTDTMSGKYLSPDSNPWLKATVNQALGDVQSKVNSQFGGNNYGTTAHQETLTRNLSDAANQAYGQNYVNERNNQMKDSLLVGQYGNIDYNNAEKLMGVGDIKRQEKQDVLNNQYSDWVSQQNQPYRQLDVLGSALSSSVNGSGSVASQGYQYSPYTSNHYANAIGGGLAGYGLGNALGGGDSTYSGLGAATGGLLGYFGG